MTLKARQITKVLEGVPPEISGYPLGKQRAAQHVNYLEFPALRTVILSQGIPVTSAQLVSDYLTEDKRLRVEIWGRCCSATLSLIIETQDLSQLDTIAGDLCEELLASELGLIPARDFMQFRGVDPPVSLPSYVGENRKLVHGRAINVVFEYLQTWKRYFDVIREVEVLIGPDSCVETFYSVADGTFYSLDAIVK